MRGVSIVIPALRRPLGLEGWLEQAEEVLILANGGYPESSSGGARVLRVPWEGHGRTRQRGIEEVQGDYVLLTVDDAVPRPGCVEALRRALEEGPYEAVYARQLPWPHSDRVTRERLAAWTPGGGDHRPAPEHPMGGRCHDHVAALYRRETLLRFPLPDVPIAEDWHWARHHRIGYQPRAEVLHAHPRRFRPLFQRTRATHREFLQAGASPTVPDLPHLLYALPGVVGPDIRGALGELLGQWTAAQEFRR